MHKNTNSSQAVPSLPLLPPKKAEKTKHKQEIPCGFISNQGGRPSSNSLIKAHDYLQSLGVQITLVETPDDQRKHWRPGKTSKQKAAFQLNTTARVSIVRCLDLITQKQISCRQQKSKMRNKGVILTHEEIISIKPSWVYGVVIKTAPASSDIWSNEAEAVQQHRQAPETTRSLMQHKEVNEPLCLGILVTF